MKRSEDDQHLIVTGQGTVHDVHLVNLMPGTGVDGNPPEYETVVAELTDTAEPDLPVLVFVHASYTQLVTDIIGHAIEHAPVVWSVTIPLNKQPGHLKSILPIM